MDAEEVRVRPATPADADEIARIWHAGWQDAHIGRVPDELSRHRTAETYPPRVLSRLPHTWVADRAGAVIGFVSGASTSPVPASTCT